MQLPDKFIQMLEGLGPAAEGLADALSNTQPEVSVRLNTAKNEATPTFCTDAERVPWCETGYYLPSRPQFTLDPLLHAGAYYVQDASSMFIHYILRHLTDGDATPRRYLDACAAPGGKTTAAINALPPQSLVVANEWEYRRADILAENIVKWGSADTMVTRGDTARFSRLGLVFDIIAADVPCSGEGMMRKDPQAVSQWTPGLVAECVARQREILDNLVPALRPGGYLIYSTCTFNQHENEEQLAWLAEQYGLEGVKIPTDPAWGITHELTGTMPALRFMPHSTRGEGLFIAVLRKSEEDIKRPNGSKGERARQRDGNNAIPDAVKRLTEYDGEAYQTEENKGCYTLVPRRFGALRRAIHGACDVISDGTLLATVKGRDIIPAHPLAMSRHLSHDVPRIELPYDDALEYLRRQAVSLPEGTPRGYVVATYKGAALGWLKNLGNRANNLYPAPYRIRTL